MKKKEVGYQRDKCHIGINFRGLEGKFVVSEKFKGKPIIFRNLGDRIANNESRGKIAISKMGRGFKTIV